MDQFSHFLSLPAPCLQQILSYLDAKSSKALCLASRCLYDFITQHAPPSLPHALPDDCLYEIMLNLDPPSALMFGLASKGLAKLFTDRVPMLKRRFFSARPSPYLLTEFPSDDPVEDPFLMFSFGCYYWNACNGYFSLWKWTEKQNPGCFFKLCKKDAFIMSSHTFSNVIRRTLGMMGHSEFIFYLKNLRN